MEASTPRGLSRLAAAAHRWSRSQAEPVAQPASPIRKRQIRPARTATTATKPLLRRSPCCQQPPPDAHGRRAAPPAALTAGAPTRQIRRHVWAPRDPPTAAPSATRPPPSAASAPGDVAPQRPAPTPRPSRREGPAPLLCARGSQKAWPPPDRASFARLGPLAATGEEEGGGGLRGGRTGSPPRRRAGAAREGEGRSRERVCIVGRRKVTVHLHL
ncbi:translation initiation factor IF-2 isoform X2 [Triticum aestivum]|uniref:translation initiation factor IF-2 isoform X2 n=1 Tax=Triticum aestivum TaxID=4565 RepID=UPI001D03587E|nr:translation initiation factor IF-2-like isoform X2 [Triticum aestivum]